MKAAAYQQRTEDYDTSTAIACAARAPIDRPGVVLHRFCAPDPSTALSSLLAVASSPSPRDDKLLAIVNLSLPSWTRKKLPRWSGYCIYMTTEQKPYSKPQKSFSEIKVWIGYRDSNSKNLF